MKNSKVIGTLATSGQQGDVTMRLVKQLPEGAKPIAGKTVRHGEATGHCHELSHASTKLYALDDKIYGVIMQDEQLLHEEHEAWKIPANTIVEFGPTYEYDYETEERKQVID